MKTLSLAALSTALVLLSGCVAYPVGGYSDHRNQGAEHNRDGDSRGQDHNRDDNRRDDGRYENGNRGQ